MDWIEATLKCRRSECFQGWNWKTERNVLDRRVNIAFEHFLVVLEFGLRDNGLKAEFVTCYPADSQAQVKVHQSKWWHRDDCVDFLRRRKRGKR